VTCSPRRTRRRQRGCLLGDLRCLGERESYDFRVYSDIYQRPGECSKREQWLNRLGLRCFERRPSLCRLDRAVERWAVPRGCGEARGSWRSPAGGEPGCVERIRRGWGVSWDCRRRDARAPRNRGLAGWGWAERLGCGCMAQGVGVRGSWRSPAGGEPGCVQRTRRDQRVSWDCCRRDARAPRNRGLAGRGWAERLCCERLAQAGVVRGSLRCPAGGAPGCVERIRRGQGLSWDCRRRDARARMLVLCYNEDHRRGGTESSQRLIRLRRDRLGSVDPCLQRPCANLERLQEFSPLRRSSDRRARGTARPIRLSPPT
jgi:hypothetical protein